MAFEYEDLLLGMEDMQDRNANIPMNIPSNIVPANPNGASSMDIGVITGEIKLERAMMNYCPVFCEKQDNGLLFTAYISGPITEVNNYADLLDVLLTAENTDTIVIYIDSPGGMIASGGLIASAIHHCKGTVKTVARGLCASAAALIHSAAKPENTSVSPMAVMLYHMSSHSDMGVSTGISARAKNQVKYVNETLLVKAKEDGHITDAEYARIQAGEDIIVPADEWNKRTHKENN